MLLVKVAVSVCSWIKLQKQTHYAKLSFATPTLAIKVRTQSCHFEFGVPSLLRTETLM